TAAELARSRPIYPVELVDPGAFLDVDSNVTMPPFGTEDPALALGRTLVAHPELVPYAPLAKLAVRVAGHAGTPYAATAALETWFRVGGGFAYANHPPATSGPPLVEFVTKTRAGYCQHFAGAMALMLRYLGIPARVAVGFSSGRYDAKRGVWTVTDHDAHAWVEVWFRGYGWLPFDPTPPVGRPERGQLSPPYAVHDARPETSRGGVQAGAGELSARPEHRGCAKRDAARARSAPAARAPDRAGRVRRCRERRSLRAAGGRRAGCSRRAPRAA